MLKINVDTLNGIDESLHSLYKEGESGFTLEVEGLEDTSGLKSALEKERLANKEGRTKLSELEKLRDESDKKKLENDGKFKELSERDRLEKIEAQKKYTDLETEIAKSRRDVLVRDLAISMTTDKDEIDIISRFAGDFVTIEGKEVSFSKTADELKTELSRFVRSKANGSGDKGNEKGDGNVKTMNRSDFENLKPAEQSKFVKDGGKVIN